LSKSTTLQIRLTPEEKAKWEAYATSNGLKLAELIRDAVSERINPIAYGNAKYKFGPVFVAGPNVTSEPVVNIISVDADGYVTATPK